MRDHKIYDDFAASVRRREATAPAFLNDSASDLVSAGLAVYRNNVRSSLSKALAETFPVVTQLVGDDFFTGSGTAKQVGKVPLGFKDSNFYY